MTVPTENLAIGYERSVKSTHAMGLPAPASESATISPYQPLAALAVLVLVASMPTLAFLLRSCPCLLYNKPWKGHLSHLPSRHILRPIALDI